MIDLDLFEHGDPDARWVALRADDPVHDAGEFWELTRYDDVVAVYRDPATFSSERGMVLGLDGTDPAAGRMLVVTDPPRHPKLRKVISGVFTPRTMRRLEDGVRSTVARLLGHAGEECEFVDSVAARLPVAMICDLLGVPAADQDWMYHLTSTAFGGGDPASAADVSIEDRAQAYGDIFLYYQELAAERRRAPGDDLVSTLVHGEVDGRPLDVEEVLLNCTNLIIGGNETTRHAASGGVLAFAERPRLWQRLREDVSAVPSAVEEILRWTTPGMHVLRTCTRDVEIRGRRIAAGEQVVAWNASANRDEEVFEAPQEFRPDRTPNRHIAFGQGGHHCLGAALARIELTVLFEELAKQVDGIEVTGEVRRVRSCVLRGLRRLPVRLRR